MNIAFINSVEECESFVKSQLAKYKADKLTINEYANLLENAHVLLTQRIVSDEHYNLGLSAICHVAQNLPDDKLIQTLLNDCISASRVFLYENMVSDRMQGYIPASESFFSNYAKQFYTVTSTGTVLTKDQKKLLNLFQQHRRLVVSAPTSFGKSRIIQEIILSNNYQNIAIVLPTIALLCETYVTLNFNQKISQKYNLINSLGRAESLNSSQGNLMILTPEKMDLVLDQYPNLKIDFFTMDEIYKIQDDPERSKIFTHCLYRLAKEQSDFYLIGPYFSNFSKSFLEWTNAHFQKFSAEIVQKDTQDISQLNENDIIKVNGINIKKRKLKDTNLKAIIKKVDGQSLVYISDRRSVESKAKLIASLQDSNTNFNSDLISYIKENISDDWSLVKLLEKKVAFHHSSIPKYIQTEIVDGFNNSTVDIIVCTTTLTEGVNTSAKNVIIYSNTKGGTALTGFDIKNIKGRAGRFLYHFVGNVYMLEPALEEEKDNIEFNYLDKQELDIEEVVQVKKNDLKNENLALRTTIENELQQQNIPLNLIRKNKFIAVRKQIVLINKLRGDLFLDHLHFEGTYPEKEKLGQIIQLCHDYLFSDNEANSKSFPIWEIIRLTKYYIYKKPNLKELIREQNAKETDTKIRRAFSLITRYFEFILPKYLTAFENIFNFVYEEKHYNDSKISLKYLITMLEFGFTNPHEIAFKEVGLPNDIIRKISDRFKDCKNIEEIRIQYRLNPLLINNLTEFEKKMFRKYV
jgi:galactitol-specific phosphotransferase system IIB component